MQNQTPISSFQDRFGEIQAEFNFERLSSTEARAVPKGDFLPRVIWLDLEPTESRLTIEAPLGPLNYVDRTAEEILKKSGTIDGYLALGRTDSKKLIVHRTELSTGQDFSVKPAVFHSYFSRFLRSFYSTLEAFFKDGETEGSKKPDEVDIQESEVLEESEPIGFNA